jgi:hypothetical protein
MTQKRYPDSANVNWNFEVDFQNRVTIPEAQLIVLMDIREELKRLNTTLNCKNALAIPNLLREIKLNTRKNKPRKK